MFDRMLRAPKPVIDVMLLFDTVASMIEWHRFMPRLRPYAYTSRNPSVRAVRHALAIDERRWLFEPTLWEPGPFAPGEAGADGPQDVEEVWFTGVHSDVGGGVPEADSGLGKIPLQWMIDEGARLGVEFRAETVQTLVGGQNTEKYVAPDPLAMPQDSMTLAWKLTECLPRRRRGGRGMDRPGLAGLYVPFSGRRRIPDGAKIHHSVFLRRGTKADFDQPNIPEDRVEV